MTQLSIFNGSERDSPPASQAHILVEDARATPQETLPPTASRSEHSCRECGSTVGVMYGTCADCFAVWKAA
jgi:hypothetical protein